MNLTSSTRTLLVSDGLTVTPDCQMFSDSVELAGFTGVRFLVPVTQSKDGAEPVLAIFVADDLEGEDWRPIQSSAAQLAEGATGLVILDCRQCFHRFAAVGVTVEGGSGEAVAHIPAIIAELYGSSCLPVQQSDLVGFVISDG